MFCQVNLLCRRLYNPKSQLLRSYGRIKILPEGINLAYKGKRPREPRLTDSFLPVHWRGAIARAWPAAAPGWGTNQHGLEPGEK
jgi:hypothetical protein